MIYAYDEPVALPTVDLYDSTAMQLYINAAREMYKQSQEELKEFLKNYGDFYSPIANDVDNWYNSTVVPLKNLIADAQANGIDLTRSQEGRALLAKYQRSIPYGDLAKMKQSAKSAQTYLENRAKMEAAGIYNPEYENFILERMGMSPIEQWDSRKNGIWQRQSPGEYKDLHDATFQWVDNNKERFLFTTPDKRYDVYGITDDDLRASLTPHLSGFVGQDLGAWYYDRARRELVAEGIDNPSNTLIMERLRNNIVTANKEYTYLTRKENEYTKEAYKTDLDIKAFGAKEAIRFSYDEKKAQNDFQRAKDLEDYKNGSKDGLPTFIQRTVDNIQSEGQAWVKNPANLYVVAVKAHNYWTQLRMNAILHGDKAKAKNAKKHMDWWVKTAKDPQKYLLNSNGTPNKILSDALTFPGYDIDAYKYTPGTAGYGREWGRQELAGTTKEQSIPGYGYKHLPVDFQSENLVFSPVRKSQLTGKTADDYAKKFNNWLHEYGGIGALVSNDVTYRLSPKSSASSPSLDIEGNVTITREQFNQFLTKINKDSDDEKAIADKLGITRWSGNSKINVKDKTTKPEFYRIPMTRVIDNNNTSRYADVNIDEFKKIYGAKVAETEAPYSFINSKGY